MGRNDTGRKTSSVGQVIVRTHWGVTDPLDAIPRAEWKDVVLSKGHWIAQSLDYRLAKALELLDEIEAHKAWEAAGMDRDRFLRFVCRIEQDELAQIREGFAIMRGKGHAVSTRTEALTARLTAQQLAQDQGVAASLSHSDAGKRGGRGKKATSIARGFTTGSAAALVARLKRDAPEIAERLARGEFRSARAAARAAGMQVDTPPLTILRRAWQRATEAEQEQFLTEVMSRNPTPQ